MTTSEKKNTDLENGNELEHDLPRKDCYKDTPSSRTSKLLVFLSFIIVAVGLVGWVANAAWHKDNNFAIHTDPPVAPIDEIGTRTVDPVTSTTKETIVAAGLNQTDPHHEECGCVTGFTTDQDKLSSLNQCVDNIKGLCPTSKCSSHRVYQFQTYPHTSWFTQCRCSGC